MRGRKPTPPALKLLKGSRVRPAKTKNSALKPRIEKLDPPPYLREDGLAEWNRLEPELRSLGILTTVDRGIFEAYCEAYGDAMACGKLLESTSGVERFVIKGPDGKIGRNQIISVRNDARRAMVRFAAELGITPASRSRVAPVNVKGESVNPFALIAGGKKPEGPDMG